MTKTTLLISVPYSFSYNHVGIITIHAHVVVFFTNFKYNKNIASDKNAASIKFILETLCALKKAFRQIWVDKVSKN